MALLGEGVVRHGAIARGGWRVYSEVIQQAMRIIADSLAKLTKAREHCEATTDALELEDYVRFGAKA